MYAYVDVRRKREDGSTYLFRELLEITHVKNAGCRKSEYIAALKNPHGDVPLSVHEGQTETAWVDFPKAKNKHLNIPLLKPGEEIDVRFDSKDIIPRIEYFFNMAGCSSGTDKSNKLRECRLLISRGLKYDYVYRIYNGKIYVTYRQEVSVIDKQKQFGVVFKKQLAHLERIRAKVGLNLVTCGNCGNIFFHEADSFIIHCPYCGFVSDPCDFPDLFY